MNDELIKRLNAIYKEFGETRQRIKLLEESEEYILCWKNELSRDEEISEIADLFIITAQMFLNMSGVKETVLYKLDRTEQRIKDGYYK